MEKAIFLPILILLVPLVNAGVSHPSTLTLSPGEKGQFNFVIDAAIFQEPLQCEIEFTSTTPLEISFNEKKITVPPGERAFMTGNVDVPNDLAPSTYKETFCVTCDRLTDSQGSITMPRYCSIPINVNVKGETQSPSQPINYKTTRIILLGFFDMLLIALTIALWRKRTNKKPIKFKKNEIS